MRLDNMRTSGNVEDRRGQRGWSGGGGRGKPIALSGLGGLVLFVLVILLGGNPLALLSSGGPSPSINPGASTVTPANDPRAELVAKVLGDTEDVWTGLFARQGKQYRPPKLVLFSGYTETACGGGESATGPFYCPADEKVYIDLSFYDAMADKLGAPGDFAQAYVIAHEVGHHIQHQLGTTQRVHNARGRISEREYNDLSVRLELQADFYAGVWAHHAQKVRNILETGDIEEAMNAAAAVGDDRLQSRSRRGIQPETFTHGTSAQRAKWFRLGLQTGDPAKGDTFSIDQP